MLEKNSGHWSFFFRFSVLSNLLQTTDTACQRKYSEEFYFLGQIAEKIMRRWSLSDHNLMASLHAKSFHHSETWTISSRMKIRCYNYLCLTEKKYSKIFVHISGPNQVIRHPLHQMMERTVIRNRWKGTSGPVFRCVLSISTLKGNTWIHKCRRLI